MDVEQKPPPPTKRGTPTITTTTTHNQPTTRTGEVEELDLGVVVDDVPRDARQRGELVGRRLRLRLRQRAQQGGLAHTGFVRRDVAWRACMGRLGGRVGVRCVESYMKHRAQTHTYLGKPMSATRPSPLLATSNPTPVPPDLLELSSSSCRLFVGWCWLGM